MTNAATIDHGSKQKTEFARFLEDEEFSDVVFVLGGDRRCHAHRQILAAMSEYFRRMFQTEMRESSEKEIRLKETPTEAFKALLCYLYTGEVDLSKIAPDTVFELFELADKYLSDDLKRAIAQYLKSILSVDNVCAILKAQFTAQTPRFLEQCLQYVDQNPHEFLKTTDFNLLDTDTLVLILQRDSFYANEEVIFDAVVKWIEFNSSLSKEDHKRLLDCVHLGEVPLQKVCDFADEYGLLTENEVRRAYPRLLEPYRNVATWVNDAKVVAGIATTEGSIDAFLDGKTEIFTKDHKVYYHNVNQPKESFTIKLSRPYVIGSVRFLLWDVNPKCSYSYYVETSLNGSEWMRVIDKTQEECKSWQDLNFTPRPLKFIKLVGTGSNKSNYLHVFHFECPSKTQ